MNRIMKFYLGAATFFWGIGLWLTKINQPFVATICGVIALIQVFLLLADKNFEKELKN